MCGLLAGVLLAEDGHAVTVLERDPAGPPETVDEAWNDWERRRVGQFRLLHYLQPRFRQEIDLHLPQLAVEMDALGAIRHEQTAELPTELSGGCLPGDERFTALTGRRPMLESPSVDWRQHPRARRAPGRRRQRPAHRPVGDGRRPPT